MKGGTLTLKSTGTPVKKKVRRTKSPWRSRVAIYCFHISEHIFICALFVYRWFSTSFWIKNQYQLNMWNLCVTVCVCLCAFNKRMKEDLWNFFYCGLCRFQDKASTLPPLPILKLLHHLITRVTYCTCNIFSVSIVCRALKFHHV